MSSKKNHRPGPVPPGNRPHTGPAHSKDEETPDGITAAEQGLQDQDPARRLGDFTGRGEHSIQEPGGKNDSDHHGQ
jgi:hypothetical protein